MAGGCSGMGKRIPRLMLTPTQAINRFPWFWPLWPFGLWYGHVMDDDL